MGQPNHRPDCRANRRLRKIGWRNQKDLLPPRYGFTRQRNGVVSMHAASCIAVVGGHYQYEGGGAFHNNGAIFGLNMSMVEAHSLHDSSIRKLDMSQVGRVLTGDKDALMGGPPVTAMLIQNTNPVSVAPEQTLIKQGFAREDLFTVVHEQFMTETALMADIVLPATQFLEHDDIYKGGGHQNILFGPKLVDAPGEAKPNLYVLNELIKRLGGDKHEAHDMTAREHIDWMLKNSKYPGGLKELEEKRWLDCQPDFDEATTSMVSAMRTENSASSPTGRMYQLQTLGQWGHGNKCQLCRIIGTSTRPRHRTIRSVWRPRHHARSSTPPSTRPQAL